MLGVKSPKHLYPENECAKLLVSSKRKEVSSLKEKLADRLRHATHAYLTEDAARHIARTEFADFEILILHSPHDGNPTVGKPGHGARMDYWIDEPGIVRSWERVLFEGLGRNA
jgi:hypothetical protein